MVVVRKNLSVEKGERWLFDDVRYFFYITNDWLAEPEEIVFSANDRCHQENLLAQLHNGVRALKAPVDNLESNWAFMVMTALAWNLKAWWALMLPERPGRWQQRHREEKQWALGLEFKTFVNAFIQLPCQIVRTGRKLVYRLLSWNPYQRIFFRLVMALRCYVPILEVGVRMLRSAAAPQATLQKREVNHVNTKAGQPYHCKDSGPEAMRTRDRPSSAARNPETFACLRSRSAFPSSQPSDSSSSQITGGLASLASRANHPTTRGS